MLDNIIRTSGYQRIHSDSCTENHRPDGNVLTKTLISVMNSCKKFSTGCTTPKDHNIQKICERFMVLTCMTPDCYTTDVIRWTAPSLYYELPTGTESFYKENRSTTPSINKLYSQSISSASAQTLYNMLLKEQAKYALPGAEFSQDNADKIQMVLDMAEKGICFQKNEKMINGLTTYSYSFTRSDVVDNKMISDAQMDMFCTASDRMHRTLTRELRAKCADFLGDTRNMLRYDRLPSPVYFIPSNQPADK